MRLASAIAFVLATVLGAMPVHAQTRVALVISNVAAEVKMEIAANHDPTAPLSAAEEQALRPKDSFKECAECPEMVVVPAGNFTMGSPDSEEGRIEEEGPQHRVTFGKSFGVGKFAVTFEEWDACAADGGCNGYTPSDDGWGRDRERWRDKRAARQQRHCC
jgi:formylglycine-generating enzyme required for sulfatase activity